MFHRTNTWNRIRYTIYLPVYDLVGYWFRSWRRLSVDSLNLKAGEKVLIIGAGTGLDLPHIPDGVEIVATDITPAMIAMLKARASRSSKNITAQVMDGSDLKFDNESFDAVILHLILAVMPDPEACLQETHRVLRTSGRFTIMDKFIRPGKKAGSIRKFLNLFSQVLATDLNRDVYQFLSNAPRLDVHTDTQLGSIFRHLYGTKK